MSAPSTLCALHFGGQGGFAAVLGVVALVVAGPVRAAFASPPDAPHAAPVLGPAADDSNFGQRMRMHRAEAEGRHHHGLPDLSAATAFSATAANFGALFEQAFRVEHQEATV